MVQGKITDADTLTIRLGTTESGLTSANLHHPPHFFTGRMPFLTPNQQCQSTKGNFFITRNMQNISVTQQSTVTAIKLLLVQVHFSVGVSRHVSCLETVSRHGFSCLGPGSVSTLVCLVLSIHVSSCLMSHDCVLTMSL